MYEVIGLDQFWKLSYSEAAMIGAIHSSTIRHVDMRKPQPRKRDRSCQKKEKEQRLIEESKETHRYSNRRLRQ